ncbi:TadE/TadG family type IV pilus assembly protein [Paenibacillus sp. CMAA1739]|uniref:TadE/TadG family type IV pilus assembly protein n=1 Tax=Paenibacillus ottowii TaxID=2315729 RepID=UPI002730EB38|nr:MULTISPECIES: TadE/TadG family type IV pilus assembly protein [Paenibacillus]MDP1509657.1 TadE/TadG family type IV pilus assembly protein [Paenibacillus ottowii]MEC4566879.1 TadE/TadG family type IV pilus assembly protein [Paenibacillus sp. CMAA1739]
MSRKQGIFPINQYLRQVGGQKQREQGSIVLEASLVLPLFLFFIIFLIYMVQMTLVSTALQTTASEAVKQVSAKIYPVSLAVEAMSAQIDAARQPLDELPKLSVSEYASQFAAQLPPPIDDWVESAVQGGKKPLEELKGRLTEAALDPVLKPMLKPFMETSILEYERVHITSVHIPSLTETKDPYFRVELSYELPMKVPFLYRNIVLQAAAEERLWIGDTGEGAGTGDETGDKDAKNSIQLLVKPEPAVKGVYNLIKAKVEPGTNATLSVLYKSGESTAQHLGWASADADGIIEWNWFVGTNTTPGQWSFVIETEDGQCIEVPFSVQKTTDG